MTQMRPTERPDFTATFIVSFLTLLMTDIAQNRRDLWSQLLKLNFYTNGTNYIRHKQRRKYKDAPI